MGHLERQTGVNYGTLIQSMHQLGRILKDVPEQLIEDYRNSPVKHAPMKRVGVMTDKMATVGFSPQKIPVYSDFVKVVPE